jgi:DNA-binding transcriptional regulator YiaG
MSEWKTLDAFKNELLKDPDFKSKYDAREPDYLIAREIIAARKAGRLTQEELAKAIGTSQSRISKWERGEETPRFDALFKIADATNTRVELSLVPADDRSS